MKESQETEFKGFITSGFTVIAMQFLMLFATVYLFMYGSVTGLVIAMLLFLCNIIASIGYFQNEPNESRIMIFFGRYQGTLKTNGFFWVNPFLIKAKLTQRARNMDVEPIKVNDKAGNPVMIGLVLVWKVRDTYKAMFEIDSNVVSAPAISGGSIAAAGRMAGLQKFVSIQSDSALRNIASEYAYDNNEINDEITLRSGSQEVADRLEVELNKRLEIAGIEVVEARINYLAYAPEIAAVMLRRQQATAIISAREKIVEGAVGMVKMALDKLSLEHIVELDDDKKAAMVSNLLVVLCSEENVQPVVNSGTLHQ